MVPMPMKNVLLLGAGMVSDPFVDYFCRKGGVLVTVATRSQGNGQRLAKIGPNVRLVVADVQSDNQVISNLIEKADLCVSLLPYSLHLAVAKKCIEKGTNMLTTSYISPELQALDNAAKAAGVTVMNECGLDPGIDHMLAMKCIDQIHGRGEKVHSFVSFCGGLPSPEASGNALRYKFSWSPRGMLLALLNPAKYLLAGKPVDVEGDGAVLDQLWPIQFMPGFSFVGYPNRDSTKYGEIYGVPECQTILRGTLRFQGFVEAIKALKAVGFLSTQRVDFLSANQAPLTWRQISAKLLHQPLNSTSAALKRVLLERLDFEQKAVQGVEAMEQLGLFSDNVAPEARESPLDTLAQHLAQQLKYEEGERDLVVLNHDIEALLPSGEIEKHAISLCVYGEPNGYSAMAQTVGYTCAIVADMMLRGEIKPKGMLRPVHRDVYEPVLKALEQFGIKASEK